MWQLVSLEGIAVGEYKRGGGAKRVARLLIENLAGGGSGDDDEDEDEDRGNAGEAGYAGNGEDAGEHVASAKPRGRASTWEFRAHLKPQLLLSSALQPHCLTATRTRDSLNDCQRC